MRVFCKTIKFHTFLYTYGSKHYFPAPILDAKKYAFHRVVDFLQYVSCIFMTSGPQRQLQESNPREL